MGTEMTKIAIFILVLGIAGCSSKQVTHQGGSPQARESEPVIVKPVLDGSPYTVLAQQAMTGNTEALDRLNHAALNDKNHEARHQLGLVYLKSGRTRDDYIFACALIFLGETAKSGDDTTRCNEMLTDSEAAEAVKMAQKLENSIFEK